MEFPELLPVADKTQNVQLSTLTVFLGSSASHPLRLGDFLNCIFSFLSAGKVLNDPRETCLCVYISCNLPLSCCEVTGVFTKLQQGKPRHHSKRDGERPNDTVLGLCACVREEMKGSWPLSPAKRDLGGRDPVSFRPDASIPMCMEKKTMPTARWETPGGGR